MATEKWLIDAWDLVEWLYNIDLENMHRMLKGKKAKWLDTKGVRHMIDTVPTVDAVEVSRLGRLGRLMMPYTGDPRGPMGARGEAGDGSDQTWKVTELDAITDVDGNRWIPVLDTDLERLKGVAVVHGRWEPHPYAYGFVRCSVCHDCIIYDDWAGGKRWNCCPQCGAKMDGGTDNA